MIGFSVRRVPVGVLAAVAASVLLAGCGSSKPSIPAAGVVPASPTAAQAGGGGTTAPSAPAGTTPPAAQPGGGSGGKACGLVSEQDASTAIGSASGPGTLGGTAASSECIYGDGALIISTSAQGKGLYDKQHAAVVGGAPAGSWREVPGVGDGAFEVNAGLSATVAFYKGTAVVEIILSGATTAPVDAAIAVATAAAANV